MTRERLQQLRKSDKYVYIDYEFNKTKEFQMNLVSVALRTGEATLTLWLQDPLQKQIFDEIMSWASNRIFVCYQAIAEARSLLDLGYWSPDLKFIDLYLEYRHLSNSNDKIQYGKHFQDGKIKILKKPKSKWERTEEEDSATGGKQEFSMAEAIYKFLGKIIDTEHKDKIRDLIISCPETFSPDEQKDILAYNKSDIELLPDLYYYIEQEYKDILTPEDFEQLEENMLNRGNYAARTAVMEKLGYPVNIEKMKNLSAAVPAILRQLQLDINSQFPENPPFRFDKNTGGYTWDQKLTRQIIKDSHDKKVLDSWTKTDTNLLSLSLKAFKRFYDYRHDYPRNNFGAQMVRYLTTKQNMNGFAAKADSTKKTIWDYVGSDNRVRPYFNIYGSQTSRSQPSSTSFLFLKSAWMRVLCEPPPGKAICGADYGSEEFLISALLAEDENMIASYKSGDVYLAYGKLIGAIPQDGTKAEYKKERDEQKPKILGMNFQMSKFGLAVSLASTLKRKVSEEEAQEQIDLFYETYPELKEYQDAIRYFYYDEKEYLKLKDGWYLFQDNDNFRSVTNFRTQGYGGVIMRKAVALAQDAGLDVIFTLHDALYIEYDKNDLTQVDILLDCMKQAFVWYFENEMKEHAKAIRIDAHSWSPEFEYEGEITTPGGNKIEQSKLYIDDRATNEYEKYKDYLETTPIEL